VSGGAQQGEGRAEERQRKGMALLAKLHQ